MKNLLIVLALGMTFGLVGCDKKEGDKKEGAKKDVQAQAEKGAKKVEEVKKDN